MLVSWLFTRSWSSKTSPDVAFASIGPSSISLNHINSYYAYKLHIHTYSCMNIFIFLIYCVCVYVIFIPDEAPAQRRALQKKPPRLMQGDPFLFRSVDGDSNGFNQAQHQMEVYTYVPPKKKLTFLLFFPVFTVFFAYFGGCFYVFLNKFGNSFEGEYHIYIYNRGCRQTCETWWFWHQEVLGGPRTSLEPRTKNQDAQKVLGESWILVLGSKEVLGDLSFSSFQTMS